MAQENFDQQQMMVKPKKHLLTIILSVSLTAAIVLLISSIWFITSQKNREVELLSQISSLQQQIDNLSGQEQVTENQQSLYFNYLPVGWEIVNQTASQVKIKTDDKPWNVYLVGEINKLSSADTESYVKIKNNIYQVGCGGALLCAAVDLNDQFYAINWSVQSNQPAPENLDGIWVPNYSFTTDDILDIMSGIILDKKISCDSADKTFIDPELGIAFCYPVGQEIITEDNTVYVGGKSGQFVEVFTKDPAYTLKTAIEKKFLKDYPADRCFVNENQITQRGSWVESSAIDYPRDQADYEPYWKNSEDCPTAYAQSNGARFFMADTDHFDKFLFLSIGQYAILLADGQTEWYETVKVLD